MYAKSLKDLIIFLNFDINKITIFHFTQKDKFSIICNFKHCSTVCVITNYVKCTLMLFVV